MASTPNDKIKLLIPLAFSIKTTMYKLPIQVDLIICFRCFPVKIIFMM